MDDNDIKALYAQIYREFERRLAAHRGAQRFLTLLSQGKASSALASQYSGWLGDCAAAALDKYLVPEKLPGGELTWDVLVGTVDRLMRDVFQRAMDAASEVMAAEDRANGVKLPPILPEYPAERVHALMESMVRRENEEEPE